MICGWVIDHDRLTMYVQMSCMWAPSQYRKFWFPFVTSSRNFRLLGFGTGNGNPECKQQPPGNGMRGGREKEGRGRLPLVFRLLALNNFDVFLIKEYSKDRTIIQKKVHQSLLLRTQHSPSRSPNSRAIYAPVVWRSDRITPNSSHSSSFWSPLKTNISSRQTVSWGFHTLAFVTVSGQCCKGASRYNVRIGGWEGFMEKRT